MAGGIRTEEDSEPISGINVTPFVDVVLVLLVIFMITAPMMLKESLELKLPKASTGEQQKASTLGIAINREGQILLNGVVYALEEMQIKIADEVKKNPQIQAIIAADENSAHKDLIKAIDLIKKLGVERYALQVDKDKTQLSK